MPFQMRSNALFRLFRLLTAQADSNFVIICTNSWDCYKRRGYGSQQTDLSELRTQNETTVPWTIPLQMWYKLAA